MKRVLAFLISAIMIFAFAGCSNNKKDKFYPAEAVADALNENLRFGEALEKSSAEIAYNIYGIDSSLCTNATVYIGSGATADEIAVFNCTDEAAAETVYETAQARLQYLLEGYSSYGPEEVPKIENAALLREGNTVILCISENSDIAQSVADSVAE